jgi:ribosomal protein S18 acetylase RimI-like enzyme
LHVIRKATPLDALPLAQLAERSFRETFATLNTAVDMDLHCRNSYSEALQDGEIANPSIATLLAGQEGAPIGFAQLRWGNAPSCVAGDAPAEIQRIYVAAAWHGKGVAQALMAACIAELKARGSGVAWLGVWERNPRAIAFYGKLGFVACGEQVFPLGNDPQRDIVMARPL